MEPFTSNDTYVCPDCGSEIKVGARSCPGCGPFLPVQTDGGENNDGNLWEPADDDDEDDWEDGPVMPLHSMTMYYDNREMVDLSLQNTQFVEPEPEQIVVSEPVLLEKHPPVIRVAVIAFVILSVVLGLLSTARIFLPR